MAQYKVPQDVEADDKLLGPFSFRQFIYLLVAGGLVALAVFLFRLFPLLVIIPIPPIILLVVLALPLKKDQPMETYLAAIVSYYLKPRIRLWTPGQRDSTIKITAPKIVEEKRTRDFSGDEANHRLSFLADIVDTGGYAIKGSGNNIMREDLVAEASTASDMFEGYRFDSLGNTIQKDETTRHDAVVRNMQEAIETAQPQSPTPSQYFTPADIDVEQYSSPVVIMPDASLTPPPSTKTASNFSEKSAKSSIIELANNPDYSVETIAKEAKRINKKEGEVFISLR